MDAREDISSSAHQLTSAASWRYIYLMLALHEIATSSNDCSSRIMTVSCRCCVSDHESGRELMEKEKDLLKLPDFDLFKGCTDSRSLLTKHQLSQPHQHISSHKHFIFVTVCLPRTHSCEEEPVTTVPPQQLSPPSRIKRDLHPSGSPTPLRSRQKACHQTIEKGAAAYTQVSMLHHRT